MSHTHAPAVARMYRSALAGRALIMLAALLACSGSDSSPVGPGDGGGHAAAAIEVTPNAPSLALGSQLALQAQVHGADGDLVTGAQVFWSSSDTTVVMVSSTGVVTGVGVGTAQVAASSGGESTIVPIAVVPVVLASLDVVPDAATVIVGGTAKLDAIAYDDDGHTLSGRAVVWATSAAQVATVDASGTVTGVAAGTATITAKSEGKSDTSEITVTIVPVAAVAVTPGSAALTVGQSASLSAVATDANGNVLSGRSVTWTSSSSGIAKVSALGLVTAAGAGTATMTATIEGKHGVAQVVVTDPNPPPPTPVASVSVTPTNSSVAIGASATLSATLRDASGATLSGRSITWSSSASNIARVSNTGVVTAAAAGTATISARSEGKTGTATITVPPPAPAGVATVAVDPSSASVSIGQTNTLTATPKDAGGHSLAGRNVSWSSATPAVATVNDNGTVTAVAAGTATITATVDGVTGTSEITVPAPPPPPPTQVATVQVNPATVTLRHNHTAILIAHVFDANGDEIFGHDIAWSSSDDSGVSLTVTLGASVLISAHGERGPVTITATCEGSSGTSVVTVN